MRCSLRPAVWVAGLLTLAVLTPSAPAQRWVRVTVGPTVFPAPRVGQPGFVSVRTTVLVPDGGSVLVGGASSRSEFRNEAGIPVLSRLPVVSRGFRNTSYGQSSVSRRVSATARIIDLREEEFRQTGFRSP